ncbi:MAG: AAA family ATPase [Nitrososphaerota archaeon]|jgi:CO dehydrogenase maturation factor|uniref:ATP-binding protein n=1 Tax=Candidatus Bathycorpusculum sp. TaxID=2994959 RepID=UPI00282C5BE7|nr:AAA family ATPase [Candidatus Termiticorpusculum sp.]MCL2256863.1 AAA family ATPase [Candidatus Termiticorpusculum sp.]MCL2293018.1 AAA family ATPase [Candidatus Termiticorpusculum sp.]MDR0459881.1 AAA family ATPase [Nitrososphaerota archaeon]
MKTLVTIGRGGTGKSSFTALMAKAFVEAGKSPILLVDADPDQNLAEMVGIDLKEAGKSTIADLIVSTFIEGGGTTFGVSPAQRIENRIWENGLYEGQHFDFLGVGTKWIEGCYCMPNTALKGALESLTKTYEYVLIDSPAGLENLNRRITSRVDDVFDILDHSKKSQDHVQRAARIIQEVDMQYKNFYLVGGYRFPDELGKQAEVALKFPYLGKIAQDSQLDDYVLNGQSLIDLPNDNAAYLSVKKVLKNLNYI